jgi:hypothetical protein
MWRVALAAFVLIGCQNKPTETQSSSPAQVTASPAEAAVEVVASDAALAIDAAPSIDAAAERDAAVPADAIKTTTVDHEGQGICKTDADCELSSWQPGCCTSACGAYAISKKLLAEKKAQETCPPKGTQLCPPPSPCPPLVWMADKAVCKKGRCVAVGHALDGRP